jgi:hypothetical protein
MDNRAQGREKVELVDDVRGVGDYSGGRKAE